MIKYKEPLRSDNCKRYTIDELKSVLDSMQRR